MNTIYCSKQLLIFFIQFLNLLLRRYFMTKPGKLDSNSDLILCIHQSVKNPDMGSKRNITAWI